RADVALGTGPVTALGGERIPREGPHQHIDDERGSDDHRDHLEESPDYVSPHQPSFSVRAHHRGQRRYPAAGYRLCTVSRCASAGGRDAEQVDGLEGRDLHVVDVGGVARDRLAVPERNGRHVRGQHGLGLVVLRDGLFTLQGRRFGDRLVELGVAVEAVVRRSVRGVQRDQEVLDRRVVHLPAGTEDAGHLAVVDLRTERGEVNLGLALALDLEGVLDAVARSVHPALVVGVTVVRDRQRSAVPTSLVEQLLGAVRVVLAVAVAGPGLEALHDRRHPTGGRLTGTGEDAVDDRLTVDGQRDGLAQLRVGQRRVHVLRRERHGLDHAGLTLDEPVAQVVLVRLAGHGRGRQLRHDVELVGLQFVVRGVVVLVDLERRLVDLRLHLALVVLVRRELDLDVALPRLELERARADRLLAEGLGVLEERRGQRREGGVAQAQRERRRRLGQLDRERTLVDDLETAHGLGRGGAFDVRAALVVFA